MAKRIDKVIDYIKGFDLQNGEVVSVTGKEVIKMSYTRRYHNCLYLLAGLTPCARNLMDYLSEKAQENEKRIVRSDIEARETFNNFMEGITTRDDVKTVKYSDSTIKSAFGELNVSGLLLFVRKGVFEVNPKFFFNGKDEERFKSIQLQIKFNKDVTDFRFLRIRDRKIDEKN
jgi:hypothetical protein